MRRPGTLARILHEAFCCERRKHGIFVSILEIRTRMYFITTRPQISKINFALQVRTFHAFTALATKFRAICGREAFLPVVMAVSLLLALSGCPKRPGPSVRFDETDLPDPEAIYHEILSHTEQVRTLQATADLRLQTDKDKASLDTVIACDREGRLRFEVLDWLNHVIFLALFDREGFLTYSAPENQYVEGPDDTVRIREILGLPLKAEELVDLALGNPFFLAMTDPVFRISVDQGVLLLDAESSSSGPRYLVWLDEQRRPERMFVMRPTQGQRAIGDLRVDYGRYRQIDSISFPHRIRVATTGSQRVLQVDYQRVLLNESLEEDLFQFTPPAGATRTME